MSLRDRIQTDITAAMRSGDSLRRDVLRMTQNAVYLVEKRDKRELAEDEIAGIVTKEVKTRRESVEAFRKGGREDLATKEEAEIAILTEYLPEQLGDDAVAALVTEAVAATGASSARDMGKVMGWLSPRTRGRADGRRVSELVARALAGADLAAHEGGAHEGGAHDGKPPASAPEPAAPRERG
ncbi:MAG TPA: GatB/YqeY domain-containing protein [Candidatus Limnocylindrales bacterium]